MAARAVVADDVLRDFDAEEAMRAELEALGEDVCSSEDERLAEDGAGDAAAAPQGGRAWGWDRDPVEDVRRAWSRREARLRRNSASGLTLGDDAEAAPGAPDAPRGAGAPAFPAPASSGDETSSEGETRETRETRAASLRACDARERARANKHARESRGARAPSAKKPAGEAAAAALIQSRWRGVAVRRRLRRARDAARRRAAAEDASPSADPLAFFDGVDEADYTPPAGLDLDAEEPRELRDAEATETDRARRKEERSPRFCARVAPPPHSPPPVVPREPRAASLEAAATEWGLRGDGVGPAEEAFLRHRARLHAEARRRARREQLKDPLERVARFRAVAAATAPAPRRKR